MLEDVEETGDASIVSFLPHGRAFKVHDVEAFVQKILPRYFNQNAWHSFTRQLSLYGIQKVKNGRHVAYYHELILRGHQGLCHHMRRVGAPKKECDHRKLVNKRPSAPRGGQASLDFDSMQALP
jgi:hypothetical protein